MHCSLPKTTMALYKTPRCKDHPALFSISQHWISYNASSNGPPPYTIRCSVPPCQRSSLPYPLCQCSLLPYHSCQCPRFQILLANFPSFLAIIPNSFVPSISFLYAHRFDTFSLTVYAPLALLKLVLLKSVAYIFICTSISMLILSKPIYIINTYFIKRIFLLSPIPRTVMIPPVFSPHPSAESHLLPVNAGRAVSYAVLNQLPHSCHALA